MVIRCAGAIGLLWAMVTHSWAQVNLVPNCSFEEHYGCIDTSLQISFEEVKDWLPKDLDDPSLVGIPDFNDYVVVQYGTPDYFNPCNDSIWSVPINTGGYQKAYEGNSYIAIAAILNDTDDFYRESVRIQLSEPLKSDKKYCAELYWASTNKYLSRVNKLGMLFSPDSFYVGSSWSGVIVHPSQQKPQFYTPQIYADSILFDTLNWHRLSGSFIANGDEEWLTIGFFFSPLEYDRINIFPGGGIYYYYIDAVKVYECDPVEEDEIILPQLLTPNGDGHNDVYFINDSLPPFTKVWIYNRWGNEVYYSENYQNDWAGKWNGNRLPSGTYFIQVVMPMGTRKTTYIELIY